MSNVARDRRTVFYGDRDLLPAAVSQIRLDGACSATIDGQGAADTILGAVAGRFPIITGVPHDRARHEAPSRRALRPAPESYPC